MIAQQCQFLFQNVIAVLIAIGKISVFLQVMARNRPFDKIKTDSSFDKWGLSDALYTIGYRFWSATISTHSYYRYVSRCDMLELLDERGNRRILQRGEVHSQLTAGPCILEAGEVTLEREAHGMAS